MAMEITLANKTEKEKDKGHGGDETTKSGDMFLRAEQTRGG